MAYETRMAGPHSRIAKPQFWLVPVSHNIARPPRNARPPLDDTFAGWPCAPEKYQITSGSRPKNTILLSQLSAIYIVAKGVTDTHSFTDKNPIHDAPNRPPTVLARSVIACT